MPQILVSGVKTNYLKKGKGPIFILIPGWKTDIQRMLPSINVISNHFTVYTLDLPGTGETGVMQGYTIKNYASFVADWIRKLGLKDFILAGVSMGGQILSFTLSNTYVKKNAKGVLLMFPLYNMYSLKMRKITLKSIKVGSSILWRRPFCTIADKVTGSTRLMKLIVRIFEKEKKLKQGKDLEYHANHFKRFRMRVSMQTINDALKIDLSKFRHRFDIPAVLVMSKHDPLIDFDSVNSGYKRIFPKMELIELPGEIHAERRDVSQEKFEKDYGPAIKCVKEYFKKLN